MPPHQPRGGVDEQLDVIVDRLGWIQQKTCKFCMSDVSDLPADPKAQRNQIQKKLDTQNK